MDGPVGLTVGYQYQDGDLFRVTEPLGRVWELGYDPAHRLTSTRSPGGVTRTVTYDGRGRVTAEVGGPGATTTWAYTGDGASPAGGATTMTDAERAVTVYQHAGPHLTAVTRGAGTPSAATVRYTYTAAALVSSVTDGEGHRTLAWAGAEGSGQSLLGGKLASEVVLTVGRAVVRTARTVAGRISGSRGRVPVPTVS